MNPTPPPSPADGPRFNNGFGPENTAIDHAFKVAQAAQPPKARQGGRWIVGAAADVPVGGKLIVQAGDTSIGVFNVGGQFHAVLNVCPHQGAPLCAGHIQTTHRPSDVHTFEPALAGRVLRCPWHGYEFDVVTGKGLYDRFGRVPVYPVTINAQGEIVVET